MAPVDILNNYKISLTNAIEGISTKSLIHLSEQIYKTAQKDQKVILVGNGGSASTASHFVCDLQKTVLGKKHNQELTKRISAICLNDNVATLTAWANDQSYEEVFAQPLKNIGNPNDLLIIISGSGNSLNILKVLQAAKKMKIKTFGLLGFDGGKAKKLCGDCIIVKSDSYGVIEDCHIIIMHMLTELLKEYYR